MKTVDTIDVLHVQLKIVNWMQFFRFGSFRRNSMMEAENNETKKK